MTDARSLAILIPLSLAAAGAAAQVTPPSVLRLAGQADKFADVELYVRLTNTRDTGYLQEGDPVKRWDEFRRHDSVLCGESARRFEVWGDPNVGGVLVAEFQLRERDRVLGAARIDRPLKGEERGIKRYEELAFTLSVFLVCR